jgi:hypothetical protein
VRRPCPQQERDRVRRTPLLLLSILTLLAISFFTP